MIYSKLHQYKEGLDEIIKPDSSDFIQSGLRTGSVIRVTPIAVVAGDILMGTVGEVSPMKILCLRRPGALFEKTAPWTVKHPQKLFIFFLRKTSFGDKIK
jgi:hypothetical protein